MRLDGRGIEERLATSPNGQDVAGVTADGSMLVYEENSPTSSVDIWTLSLSAGVPQSPRPFLQTPAAEGFAKLSADGRWLAYQSNQSGRFEIYVRPFPEGDRVVQVSNVGGMAPVWSRSGTDLFYPGLDGNLMMVTMGPGPEPSVSTPRVLFDARGYENAFDVSPDGKRFLMMPVVNAEAVATQINVVLNFVEELRRRVR
jgi:hypothetical protein